MNASAWHNATPEVCATALAGLSWFVPPRLAALLAGRSPCEAVTAMLDPRREVEMAQLLHPRTPRDDLVASWRARLQTLTPAALEERNEREGVEVWLRCHPMYPPLLEAYRDPPEVLFVKGDASLLHQTRRVAIVGTRRCTVYGRDVAERLGADLTRAGVHVVSGLAVGIDGAAHEGALRENGRPIGVVGSGHDVVYPRRHRSLWHQTIESGVLLSEAPPGARPEAWRFPFRNRIIAGLSEVVVVVESAMKGGSQLTVNAALERGIDVMAVPGPVGAPSSAGTNQLLVDGVAPVLGADQVLDWMGIRRVRPAEATLIVDASMSTDAELVLDALPFVATATERLLRSIDLSPGRLSVALEELAIAGRAAGGAGWWRRVP